MGKKINNKERQREYQEKYEREFPRRWFKYCLEPLENIEGWAEMLNDTSGQLWHLHHRDEISEEGAVVLKCELKNRGVYYSIPANKLIFMTEHEHHKLHIGDGRNPMCGRTGELHPNYGTNKYDITEEELQELYVVQGLSQQKVAEKFRCTRGAIRLYLRKYKIKR